jgi:hypothetical protein
MEIARLGGNEGLEGIMDLLAVDETSLWMRGADQM